MNVYLVASDPSDRHILSTILACGGKLVIPSVSVLPWAGTARQLGNHLAPLLSPGSRVVVAELLGDWHLV